MNKPALRHLSLLLFALLFAGCATSATRAPGKIPARSLLEPDALRVLAWNLGTAEMSAGTLDDDNVEIVVETLEMVKADVVLLQSVSDPDQATQIVEMLTDRGVPYVSVHTKADPDRPDALLVTLFGGSQGEARTWQSSEGYGILSVPAKGMLVINVHGPHRWAPARNRFFREAATWAAEHKGVVVMGGSFSVDPEGRQRALWFSWPGRDRSTFRLIRNAFPVGTEVGPTTSQEWALDHIRARFARVVVQARLEGHRQGAMSHDPILAEIAPLLTRPGLPP